MHFRIAAPAATRCRCSSISLASNLVSCAHDSDTQHITTLLLKLDVGALSAMYFLNCVLCSNVEAHKQSMPSHVESHLEPC